MSLEEQKTELESLGFKIVSVEDDGLVGIRTKWHWDCILTKLTYVVFVRKVAELTADIIEQDRETFRAKGKQLDPSILPRGFQKGVVVLVIYVADKVEESAKRLCTNKPKLRFAFFFLPAVLDRTSGQAFYLKSTPKWGAIYYAKFRFIIRRLIERNSAPSKEPVSVLGIVLGLLVVVFLALSLVIIFST